MNLQCMKLSDDYVSKIPQINDENTHSKTRIDY